jgi:hypothetical protein
LGGVPDSFGLFFASMPPLSTITITKPFVPSFPLSGGDILYGGLFPQGYIDSNSYPPNRSKKTYSITGLAAPLNSDVGMVTNDVMFIFDANGNPLSKEYTLIKYLDNATGNIQSQLDNITSSYIPQTDIGVTVQPFLKNNQPAGVAPTTANDSSQGYSYGSQWINSNNIWICTNPMLSNAAWEQVSTGQSTQIAILDRYKMSIFNGVGGTLSNSPNVSPTNGPYFLLNSTVGLFNGWDFSDNNPGAQSWVTLGTITVATYLMSGTGGNWWKNMAGVLTDTGSTQYTVGAEGTSYHIYYTGFKLVLEEIAIV